MAIRPYATFMVLNIFSAQMKPTLHPSKKLGAKILVQDIFHRQLKQFLEKDREPIKVKRRLFVSSIF